MDKIPIVWRVNLKLKKNKKMDSRIVQFCIDEGYVMMGWRPKSGKKYVDATHYVQDYDAEFQIDRTATKRKPGYEVACEYYFEMNKGDICLLRNEGNIYYIGEVIDDMPIYAMEEDLPIAVEYGVSWVRKVKWQKIGEHGRQNETPARIVGLLSERRQATISKRISDIVLRKICALVLKKENIDNLPSEELNSNNFANTMYYHTLEDLVALYLQKTRGYLFYASSAKATTPAYEYILIDEKKRQHIYVQVKQNAPINLDDFKENDYGNALVYVFSNVGYIGKSKSYIKSIDKESLFHFFKKNHSILQDSFTYEKMLFDFESM
ncbi:hypothetical protein LJC56_10280 [Christensenellaceae bacterium OttesenSCG-928-K19]|nr:hypothetical protein [Christensenellaceae bacterium OttesenSCG-928-K19]